MKPTLFLLALIVGSHLNAQNLVDIGLFPSPIANTLEIRVMPTSSFNLVVSEVTFTIRWSTASGANLGAISQNIDGNTCAATTVPLQKSTDGEVDVAGFRYQTISAFGFQQLQQCSGYSWPGGQGTVIAQIPITNLSGCVNFNIVNDTYTGANNKDFYLSLGGEPSTGSIYSPAAQFGSCGGLLVNAKVFLDGGYVSATGLMRDNLRQLPSFPTAQPYAGAPRNYSGTETLGAGVLSVTGNNAIVDWVLLELRSSATSAVITRKAALIQRDGDIVGTDGVSAVSFTGVAAGNYRLAVRHRNHLGVMTANTFAFSATPITINLTLAGTATFGTNARKTVGSVMTLWGGDANSNGTISYAGTGNDRNFILNVVGAGTWLTSLSIYNAGDVTLDGVVSYTGGGNDRSYVLNTLGASTYLTGIVQQLP